MGRLYVHMHKLSEAKDIRNIFIWKIKSRNLFIFKLVGNTNRSTTHSQRTQ